MKLVSLISRAGTILFNQIKILGLTICISILFMLYRYFNDISFRFICIVLLVFLAALNLFTNHLQLSVHVKWLPYPLNYDPYEP